MATANCTVNGINYYTSSNSYGVWGSSSWIGVTTEINNKPCFGKFYYGGTYKYRALVFKITTPTYPSNAHSKILTISVGLRRTSSGSDNWHCAISTTAPSFSNASSAQIPNNWVTTWNSISTNSTYATKSFSTAGFNFKSNTTYYLWMYSDTPTGNNTTGFFSNNYGSAPTITVKTSYSTQTSNGTYSKPTNPSLYGIKGYYHGAKLEIDTNTEYPICFVGTSPTGTFYHKTLTTSTDGRQYFSVDADTSSTTKTYYIIRTTQAYYNSLTTKRLESPPTAYQTTYKCPRYACQIYCHSQEPLVFYNVNSPTSEYSKFNGMTALGLSKTETGMTVDMEFSWNSRGSELNGGTFYMLYEGTKTSTYYCGGSTASTHEYNILFYGKNSTSIGINDTIGGSSPSYECETDSSYSLIGWTGVVDNVSPEYETLNIAAEYEDVIYGVYDKSESITYYPQNGDSSGVSTTTNYVYGTGQLTSNIPAEPSLFKTNNSLAGWGTQATDTVPKSTWNNYWNSGVRTVYAIWIPNNSIYFGNSSLKSVNVYYGVSGVWKPAVVRIGRNDKWLGGI